MSKSQLLIDVLEVELEAIEDGTARIREALREAVVEVRAHRAMVKRLEEWAEQLDIDRLDEESRHGGPYINTGVGAHIAAELRNRMKGE